MIRIKNNVNDWNVSNLPSNVVLYATGFVRSGCGHFSFDIHSNVVFGYQVLSLFLTIQCDSIQVRSIYLSFFLTSCVYSNKLCAQVEKLYTTHLHIKKWEVKTRWIQRWEREIVLELCNVVFRIALTVDSITTAQPTFMHSVCTCLVLASFLWNFRIRSHFVSCNCFSFVNTRFRMQKHTLCTYFLYRLNFARKMHTIRAS